MTIYVTADLHFGDRSAFAARSNCFTSLADMETTIVDRWNATVKDHDTVFVLGDVSKGRGLDAVRLLHGTKHLVAGNVDDLGATIRSGYFHSVKVIRWLRGAVLSHVPVHPSQLRGKTVNVHGHLHEGTVGDPKFVCVSVDQTGYSPVPLATLLQNPMHPELL